MKLQVDGTCAKVRHATKQAAKASAKRGTREGRRLTVYECPLCGAWHTTKVVSQRRRR